jgi:thymidylate synthase (FAD)
MNKKMNVLDGKGYVRLVDKMGNDTNVVNAARASYDKSTDTMTDGDIKLLKFLAREGHLSPFRHVTMTFEVYAPLMVTRQWEKYIVGSDHTMDARNESSRRYITEEPTFYVPKVDEWRKKPANSKQGSGGNFTAQELGIAYTDELERFYEYAESLYDRALGIGIAPEQARLFLPAYGMYVRWRWTASIQSVAHFLNQRLAHDSQWEIQQYAQAVYELVKNEFPHSIEALIK